MNWPVLAGAALLLVALIAFLYWQLNMAEGVYLGRRVVIWLYDHFAPRYDAVKQFNLKDEDWLLGGPLARALQSVPASLVLDVATGTGRLPLALFRQPTFTGRIVGLDLSRQMLHYAAINSASYQDRLTLLWQGATQLPFQDGSFHAVTCLEALEFLPDKRATLAEMVRVLRPGGVFFISNRIGPATRWMPGHTMSREKLFALLETLSLSDVGTSVWQVDYDLIWARKPIMELTVDSVQIPGSERRTLPDLFRCPRCGNSPLLRQDGAYGCDACGSRFPITENGVVEMGV
jgi:ubiquinone/menaquinone biosynthesis C-methylase UbiE